MPILPVGVLSTSGKVSKAKSDYVVKDVIRQVTEGMQKSARKEMPQAIDTSTLGISKTNEKVKMGGTCSSYSFTPDSCTALLNG